MLIDHFLPEYDATEVHHIFIEAAPAVVFSALRSTDFSRPLVVRMLLGMRALPARLQSKRHGRREPESLTLDTILNNGFVLLAESPTEVVLGLVGKFWTPTGCIEKTDADRFISERRAGLAKAAWSFALEPASSRTRLITETRVKCTDKASLRSFRAYWFFIRPFSGLLRQYMLREIKKASERAEACGR